MAVQSSTSPMLRPGRPLQREVPSVSCSAMEMDDGHEDDEPIPPLLPPDDRLWRHPSELEPTRRRRRGEGRVLLIATLSGVIGALLATGVLTVTGTMRTRTDTVR